MTILDLKIIALLSLILDHIGKFISSTPVVLRWLGRLAAPIFLFVASESWTYTSSKGKYLLRLYLSSVLMGALQYILDIDNNFFRQLFCVCCWFTLTDLAHQNKRNSGATLLYMCYGS